MRTTLIALVGRPNVGKSTLFNRLSIRKKAIVHNKPGVTRDRKYARGRIGELEFNIVDTPGLEYAEEGCLEHRMMQQTIEAIKEADLVCLVVDNLSGVIDLDKVFATMIRKHNSKHILIANKCEKSFNHDNQYYKLGFGDPVPVSAEHGLGLVDLYEAVSEKIDVLGSEEISDPIKYEGLQIVIAGRPNAGKSTFINAILGQERLLTGPEAGITRESIEVDFEHNGNQFRLIDTAGLRKKSNVHKSLEKLSTSSSIESINYANTVILMLDASMALEHQDLNIASYTIEQGRSIVIVVNKWDLIKDKEAYKEEFFYKINTHLPQVKGIPVVFISALEKHKITEVLDACVNIYKLWNKKISTSKLNDWLSFAITNHPLPINKKLGRRVRIKYITQINTRPPTFKLFCNVPSGITEAYKKYLMNLMRDDFNLMGVPIRLRFVKSDNPYAKRKK